MIPLILGAGLTVITTTPESPSLTSGPIPWACAYVAERLPRTLALLGDDTLSGEETRAARRSLALADAILTRASSLSLARALRATRLIVVRCLDRGDLTTLEAQPFDAVLPSAGALIRVTRPRLELAEAIDAVAQRLAETKTPGDLRGFRAPSNRALTKAGPALTAEVPMERVRLLLAALSDDPQSIDLRLSALAALLTARDFETAIRLGEAPPLAADPPLLVRVLRFQTGAAQLEAGRYAEARETFEGLLRSRESAAVLNNLGVAHFRLRTQEAARLFERATFLPDQRQREIEFNRSLAWIFEGKADLALPALESALQSDPGDARTQLLKVWALTFLKREGERATEWDRLLTIAPSFAGLSNPDLARRLERIFLSEQSRP